MPAVTLFDAAGPKEEKNSRFDLRPFPGKTVQAVAVRSQTFTRDERILKRADFIQRTPNTRKIRSPNFLVIVRPNRLGRTRLGLSVGKNRGGAVQRNRLKRLLREFFRKGRERLPASRDIIIIALKGSNPLTYRQVFEELAPLLD